MSAARIFTRLSLVARGSLLHQLDARDRALFVRCVLPESCSRLALLFWTTLTHLGGSFATIAAATIPLLLGGPLQQAAAHAAATLVVSHLVVQAIKRTVGRPRPSLGTMSATLAAEPDRFSFPSGHSAAAMSLALAYGMAFPALAAPLITIAALVGLSRIVLGVHYPGDVLMGQVLAAITGLLLA